MQFANAIWLWGLAGLIIPIGIHLLSRKQGNVIKFGSIRHLDETSTRQFKAIRLNEFLLLAFRCLFIILLVLMLAQLQIDLFTKKSKLLLVEGVLEEHPKYLKLIDSLRSIGFQIRDFSQYDNNTNSHTVANAKGDYWNILQQLKDESEVVILSYSYVEGFKGKRITLPEGVSWITAEPDSTEYDLDIIELSNDSAIVRRGISQQHKTSYNNVVKSKQAIEGVISPPETISIAVVFDPPYEYDKNILVAALQAINSRGRLQIVVDPIPGGQYISGEHAWTIWLSDKIPPEVKNNFILLDEDKMAGRKLFHQTTSKEKESWLLTTRLNEEIALREHLAVQLAIMLQPQEKYEDRASEFDRRVLDEKMRWSSFDTKAREQKQRSDNATSPYICIAMLLVLCAERLLAFKRNQ
jgi:hypothetical protein